MLLETTLRNEPLFPKKKPRAKSLSDRQVILQMTAGNGVFFFVTERTDIGMQKPMIHMNLQLHNCPNSTVTRLTSYINTMFLGYCDDRYCDESLNVSILDQNNCFKIVIIVKSPDNVTTSYYDTLVIPSGVILSKSYCIKQIPDVV